MRLSVTILFLCLISTFTLSAQFLDSLESRGTQKRINPWNKAETDIQKGKDYHVYDSSFLNFQQYQPLKRLTAAYQDLGDIGTPYVNTLFNPVIKPGFNLGLNQYNAYYLNRANSQYYFAPVPFTKFYYTQGSAGEKGMINFEALHTQNIAKRWNMAVNYRSITNEGFYLRQKNSMKNAQLTTHYTSKKGRYHIIGSFSWNKVKTQESGGIRQDNATDSLFRHLDRAIRAVPVGLNSANTVQRYREHYIKQYFWLAGSGNDTSKTAPFKPLFGFAHSLTWQKQAVYYTDQGTDRLFYDSITYFNLNGSYDTTGMKQLTNRFELIQNGYGSGLTHFNAAISHDYISVYQAANKLNYRRLSDYNLYLDATIGITINKLDITGTAKYYFAGYNSGNYYGAGAITLPVKYRTETLNFRAFTESQLYAPARLQTTMFSNHYIWERQFNQTLGNRIGFEFSGRSDTRAAKTGVQPEWLNLSGTLNTISNLVYFDQNGQPQQYTGTLAVTSLGLTNNLDLKAFQVNTTLLYQALNQTAKNYIRIPELLVKSQLFYQKRLFKKVMFFQIGVDVLYTTQYYGQYYNPSTHQFQLQDKVQVGNYPYLDFFINGEVKTLRYFLKIEHFNQDMIGGRSGFPNYFYSSPYAPSAPRRLRIGLAWRFYS